MTDSNNTSTIDQFPSFYAARPEWLTDDERQAFAAKYPELVEEHNDCWQMESEGK
jgi:hypothetical protein